jgi:large subunit ribosomal protein L18
VSIERKVKARARRRALRTRKRISGEYPRVSVFRSLRSMYAQIIDDRNHKTMLGLSLSHLENLSGDKTEQSHMLGVELAKKASAQGIKKVVFDRGSYRYHGRVKSFADGLREGGLVF